MTLELAGMFHVGMVVADVAEAMDDLGASLGMTWAPVQDREITVAYRGDVVTTPLTFTYSRHGPVHLELISVAPGTPWDTPNAMHHVGFWADDLRATLAEYVAGGMTLDVTYDDPSGEPVGFGYLLSPTGLRLEFVDSARRADMEEWIGGSDSYPAVPGN